VWNDSTVADAGWIWMLDAAHVRYHGSRLFRLSSDRLEQSVAWFRRQRRRDDYV